MQHVSSNNQEVELYDQHYIPTYTNTFLTKKNSSVQSGRIQRVTGELFGPSTSAAVCSESPRLGNRKLGLMQAVALSHSSHSVLKVSHGISQYLTVSPYLTVSQGISRYLKVSQGISRYLKVSQGFKFDPGI